MNRRSLLALGAGLVVGEPARRAYSFLNGRGFDRRAALQRYIDEQLQQALAPLVGNPNPNSARLRIRGTDTTVRFLDAENKVVVVKSFPTGFLFLDP